MHKEAFALSPLRVLSLVHEMFALSAEERQLLLRLVDGQPPSFAKAMNGIDEMRQMYARDGADKLSDREKEVLGFIMAGVSNKEIGRILGISPNTVQVHRRRTKDKLGADTTADLVWLATAAGLKATFHRR